MAILKLVVTEVYEVSVYNTVSVYEPTSEEELVEKVRTGYPKLVEAVTYVGVAPLSVSVTVVVPQIEDVVLVPSKSFAVSLMKG